MYGIIWNEQESEPSPDIGVCAECGGEFTLNQLYWEWESDGWENPSYEVAICPICEDGGCVDDWIFSDEQWKKYLIWKNKRFKEGII